MAHPTFTVKSQETIPKKAQVNLLPCRIHHDGNVNPIDTYWNPQDGQGMMITCPSQVSLNFCSHYMNFPEQTKTAYLRGRKLQGKAVKLPEGYYGSIVEKSEPKKPEKSSNDEEMTEVIEIEDDSDDQIETGAMKGKATFDELMVWNHESLANSSEDPYLRGMEEWISFTEQVRLLFFSAQPYDILIIYIDTFVSIRQAYGQVT